MDDMKERLVMLRYDGYADVADLVENLDYKVNYCISQEAEVPESLCTTERLRRGDLQRAVPGALDGLLLPP